MSKETTRTADAAPDGEALLVRMRVWHPGCWNIEVSEEVDAGLLGYGLFRSADDRAICRLTAYGDTVEKVEAMVERARRSEQTYAVYELDRDYRTDRTTASPGNATRELLVERSLDAQISEAFLSRGFVYAEPIVIEDGIEQWTVLTTRDRADAGPALEEIRTAEDAVIDLVSMRRASDAGDVGGTLPVGRLSQRQREVFRAARRRGYYEVPRETTPHELADDLSITTSTLHEHLRKAEAKLLGRGL